MSLSEEYKTKLENFLKIFTNKISDKDLLQEIEDEYNNLMEICMIF